MQILNRFMIPVVILIASTTTSCISTGSNGGGTATGEATSLVYIGTYTGEKSKGVYVSRFNSANGAMSKPELVAEMVNPSWLAIRPGGKFLYVAGEYGPYPNGGEIAGFAIGPEGALTHLNSQAPNGNGPCHLAIDHSGRTIVASNYGNGSFSSLQIGDDGMLSASDWQDLHPALDAKNKAHGHCFAFDPENRFALACDAGIDRIYSYRYDAANGALAANTPPFTATAGNAHPRHLTFSSDSRFVYCINEAAMSVTVYRYDAASGSLHEIQSISTLPGDFAGKPGTTAELVMHPSGKFLYGTNRGPDNLVAYRVNRESGKLSLISHTDTQGSTARSFGIDPSGRWLLLGNQKSDTIVQFEVNLKSGELTPTGRTFELGSPVCFQFLALKP